MPDLPEDEHTAEQTYVEDVGVVLEQVGFPRMAARVVGWLLICEPSHQSPGELAIALQASKASISTSVRLLIQIGIVERVAFPGKRRDYYRIRDEAWSRMTEERMDLVTTIRELAERGIALRASTGHTADVRLREMREFYAFYEREMPAIIARWREEWQCKRHE
jgi:DNA-binding transcriptional regulator GbsR (MarR family)